jgi:hypothetical protein
MMGYRALEEAVSMLKKYGKEVARLLNQEHEDPNVLRYQLYVLRRRICRRLEKLGLAVRESWEVERGLAERGRGDYYERVEGYCLTDGQGNVYVASVKWVFQVMGDGGRRFWFEGVELGRAKAGSIDEVIARITGGADDRGAEEEKKRGKVRVRMIARIRAGGGMMKAQQGRTTLWHRRSSTG